MAISELWQTPAPSSSFLEGVSFTALPGRLCSLAFKCEGATGGWVGFELRFHQVAAFKCTYLPALTVEMIQGAYDRLVDLGNSAWLTEAISVRAHATDRAPLRHFRITFDDGPCYEFLATRFEVIGGH